ncbi:MAG: hypothetical protein P9M15_01480 [Candidatus Electryoneaceae bacterium]|nr:hypothetical protein [Candidatus Electryoneaceae bacterium]
MPTKEVIRESLIAFAQDKGYIFWAIAYLFVVIIASFIEAIVGTGGIFDYVFHYKFRVFLMAIFAGSIIDYAVKANVEVTAIRNKYIFKPPIYLRRFRRWTNVFAVLGVLLSFFLVIWYPGYVRLMLDPEFLMEFPGIDSKYYISHGKSILVLPVREVYFGIHFLTAITYITGFMLCLAWAFMGLFLTEKDLGDRRVAYYAKELRFERVRRFNRASAFYIGGMFVSGVIYYKLSSISGLWHHYISHARIIYNVTKFWKDYFSWVDTFVN